MKQLNTSLYDVPATIKIKITTANLNIGNSGGCRDTATGAMTNIFIQFGNDMRACAADYSTSNGVVKTNIDKAYSDVQVAALTALNNITECLKASKLSSDPTTIDMAPEAVRSAFLACLEKVELV